ncbi:MAG: ATP-binding cassette domain-containing protein [Planctomycetes bacterium]|nr:ATP-binding cassette domain-containing protein [Planctomycetota bacterium]
MNDANPLLVLEHVAMHYEAVEGSDAPPVLRDVNLTLNPGQSLAIIGPSGCGKSTLLNIIGTLDRPTGGRVLLEGRDLATLDDRALAQIRNQRLGFIFQEHHLLPQCTVLENVMVPTLVSKSKDAEARAKRLLERVGLADRMHHRPGQLSGGQRQRAAVVRALINEPALLLADEPTGSLDRASSENLAQLLVELNREENVTLIVVTHAPDLAKLMQQVMELRDGELAAAKAS